MGEGKLTKIKPIRFIQIPDDRLNDHKQAAKDEEELYKSKLQDLDLIQSVKKLKPNFSFEYTYPAVIFDKVCFSIDRSQQQANFLNECLLNLRRCVSPADDSSRQKIDILKSINLSVPYGSIFGLLGPSSCGKTTLLRCLVGLLRPTSGSIRLFCNCSEDFDKTDDDKEGVEGCCRKKKRADWRRKKCKVPGSNVGYMPQDLGLYEDFTIRQLLTMFGQYMRMSSKLTASRIEFMAKFLDLPPVDREISSLSGGQKRRVSFAIACLHMPPLLILDEPTVGVDPLLRKSIWKYLRRLADEENKTIIITTHYIEEAAQADQVALMRAGEILVQDSPQRIMESNNCKTLEEAFLKICNNVQSSENLEQSSRYKLYPQPKFTWNDKFKVNETISSSDGKYDSYSKDSTLSMTNLVEANRAKTIEQLVIDGLKANVTNAAQSCELHDVKMSEKINKLSMEPNSGVEVSFQQQLSNDIDLDKVTSKLWNRIPLDGRAIIGKNDKVRSLRGQKLIINNSYDLNNDDSEDVCEDKLAHRLRKSRGQIYKQLSKNLTVLWALLYKNYRRNVNSLPLLAFQFMLPVIQMISFSLCVGGRPMNIGLGLVNHDQPTQFNRSHLLMVPLNGVNGSSINTNNSINSSIINSNMSLVPSNDLMDLSTEELLSDRYLSFVDESMISIHHYNNLQDALDDVRKAKLWAAMEISENFTSAILQRFDLENFYQLDAKTMRQSVIRLYPDRSNKILDMICHRSLVNSYRKFLLDQFDQFKKLPIEVKEPIFSIAPNLISNSIDGYTESIAAGLLASLTYIMAAGLTTFIMVVERSAGILERTYTSGINPVAYLIAHAVFRTFVMMLQIAVVLVLTFYILRQPLVGSIWLAYSMLMILNLTGIAYGLLISSIVTDQNGAALTIVSSLVVKITMSGILWPFEAIPRWLRTICYIQPLTMPIQALKGITLKGAGLEDRVVQLGFFVSLTWLALFLTISAKRFKFYQH